MMLSAIIQPEHFHSLQTIPELHLIINDDNNTSSFFHFTPIHQFHFSFYTNTIQFFILHQYTVSQSMSLKSVYVIADGSAGRREKTLCIQILLLWWTLILTDLLSVQEGPIQPSLQSQYPVFVLHTPFTQAGWHVVLSVG